MGVNDRDWARESNEGGITGARIRNLALGRPFADGAELDTFLSGYAKRLTLEEVRARTKSLMGCSGICRTTDGVFHTFTVWSDSTGESGFCFYRSDAPLEELARSYPFMTGIVGTTTDKIIVMTDEVEREFLRILSGGKE